MSTGVAELDALRGRMPRVDVKPRLKPWDGLPPGPKVRVAIVGNGPSAQNGRGAAVDAHEVVVRFNFFHTEPPFDRTVGAKTTEWWTCADYTNPKRDGMVHRHASYYDRVVFVGFGANLLEQRNFKLVEEHCVEAGTPILPIPQDFVASVRERMPLKEPIGRRKRMTAIPSSGLLAIAYWLEVEGEPAVDILGFDSFQESGAKGSTEDRPWKHHYFHEGYTKPQTGWHSPEAERAFIDAYRREGLVRDLAPWGSPFKEVR